MESNQRLKLVKLFESNNLIYNDTYEYIVEDDIPYE